MSTVSYEQLQKDYSEACRWLVDTLGRRAEGRMTQTGVILHELCSLHQEGLLGLPEKQPLREAALQIFSDAMAFVEVFAAFGHTRPSGSLRESLLGALEGPLFSKDERSNTASVRGRNFLFELSFAELMKRAGVELEDIENGADGVFSLGHNKIHCECKRVQSIDAIESNYKKAKRQLRTRLGGDLMNPGPNVGVVALDISKGLDRGSAVLVARSSELARQTLGNFTERGANVCAKELRRTKEVGILGAFFYSRLLIGLPERITVGSFWVFTHNPNAVHHSELLVDLQRRCSVLQY